ncbi:class I SAM-dependent methyltransferase [uncultured Brachyspira sp.]|uniref:class I SAM-dependent methyltransferase n=1 Tax=uncultured Brachyspira sp. TaxID=221953 RepID=UPI00262F49F6|nr:class I SAM-dependent methyltransferase [uncultured Brachyspira sp.]
MICEVCGSDNYSEIGTIKNIWQSDKKVYQCCNCSLYFIDLPTDEEIYALYKNEYHNNIKNKLFETAKSKMRYARSLSQFNFIKNYIDFYNKKVCEIGAFDGLLLNIFKKNGCDVYGYELNDNARLYAKNKYDIDLKPNFLESKEKYDIIMLSHVIEHFKNPFDVLIKIKNMLKDDGYLYIEVPNSPNKDQCSYDMLMRYLSTEHIVNFNIENLKMFVKKANLNIIECKYSNYSVSKYNNNLRANILEGSIPNISNLFSFALFGIKTFIVPESTFIEYSDNNNIWSYGENIRIIAQLKK